MNPQSVVPVLIVAHRRLDKVRQVVEACVAHCVQDVTVVIDGPRSLQEARLLDDVEACVRDAPWPGEARVLRREQNLGVGLSVPAACDYMFLRHRAAIVLEDDCVPTSEFLRFAGKSLNAFASDRRIGLISGVSLVPGLHARAPVLLSRFPLTWGWATWRDRWTKYRHSLVGWRSRLAFRSLVADLGPIPALDWMRLFDATSDPSPLVWDHQMTFMLWAERQRSLNPLIDLVENIGFDGQASNTSAKPFYAPNVPPEAERRAWLNSFREMMARGELPRADEEYDALVSRGIFSPSLTSRISRRIQRARRKD